MIPEATPVARVLSQKADVLQVAADAAAAPRLAVDLEASGMWSYRANLCTVQLAWGGHVVVVDALATPAADLAGLLGESGPVKIVHDVSFDARVLAEAGVVLGRVHDTSIAARMLGRAATGLASLLESELGQHITKDLQQHDWRIRPLDAATLAYLAADVAHLAALEEKLWAEVVTRGIEAEVLEETRYRLAGAVAAVRAPDDTPPYARVKGIDRLSERELAALRVLAQLREEEAERRDVPPHRVASADALVGLAKARPTTLAQVAQVKGVARGGADAKRFAEAAARALADAPDTLPPEEKARFERPRLPAAMAKARREREARLSAWRREEAKRRGVDEQVVLPGHCLKDAADMDPREPADLLRVAGIGAFRVDRDGEAMLRALQAEGPVPGAPETT